MRFHRRRRVCAAIAVVAALTLSTPAASPADAVEPPVAPAPVALPRGPAAPSEPTERSALCAESTWSGARDRTLVPPGQLMLDVTSAWRFSRGSGQRIAVIDTGVTPHPRLPRLRGGGDYVSTGDGLHDCDAHGTLVAGIIAAAPSVHDGFAGVAPDSTIISIRQSSGAYRAKSNRPRTGQDTADTVVGSGYGSVRTLASAIVRAVDLGATVINISQVACLPASSALDDAVLGAAVRHAHERDVVVVAAAGNVSTNSACREQNPWPTSPGAWSAVTTVATPAWYDRYVLTVGAVDSAHGNATPFSLRGPWVGVAAPGTDIVSLDATPGSGRLADGVVTDSGVEPILGTSFAAPYVAGTAALVRARFPHLSAAQVIDRIRTTAHGVTRNHDAARGYGVIDPLAALTATIPEEGQVPARTIAAPTPSAATNGSGRVIASIGVGACVVLGLGALALASPYRRIRRLDPDEF